MFLCGRNNRWEVNSDSPVGGRGQLENKESGRNLRLTTRGDIHLKKIK